MYIANKFKQQTQNVSLKSVILACAVFFLPCPRFYSAPRAYPLLLRKGAWLGCENLLGSYALSADRPRNYEWKRHAHALRCRGTSVRFGSKPYGGRHFFVPDERQKYSVK